MNELNDASDFNELYNKAKNNIINEYPGKLNKSNLEPEDNADNKNMIKINNNNKIVKTQGVPKTYLYEKNNIQEQGNPYNYNSLTKYKQDRNLNLENVDDEDQITTNMIPKVYGVTTRARERRDDDNK